MGLKRVKDGVKSFLIQHSLPRFPLADDPKSIFDANINVRAQHFVCVSMYDPFLSGKVKNGNRRRSSDPLDQMKNSNFFKILSLYLKPINPFYSHKIPKNSYFYRIFNEIQRQRAEVQPSSFSIQSASRYNYDKRIDFQIFAKAPETHLDLYDDVAAVFSIHHEDYSRRVNGPIKTGHLENKSSMLMIAQSHTDPATLGINQRTLLDMPDYFATVHILNSSSVTLPVNGGGEVQYHSMYRDHSKWSVNVIYGMEGSFPALLCFYDLNRSNKQATRGGGVFCLNSSFTGSTSSSMKLWEMFMNFQPKPTDMARFKNTSVPLIVEQVFGSGHDLHPRTSSYFPDTSQVSAKFSPDITRNDLIIENVQLTVPCPYKYKRVSSITPRHLNDKVESQIPLRFHQAVRHYGLAKINDALHQYKLRVSKIFDPSFQSPAGGASMIFTPGTVQVVSGSHQKKRTRIDEAFKEASSTVSAAAEEERKDETDHDDFIDRMTSGSGTGNLDNLILKSPPSGKGYQVNVMSSMKSVLDPLSSISPIQASKTPNFLRASGILFFDSDQVVPGDMGQFSSSNNNNQVLQSLDYDDFNLDDDEEEEEGEDVSSFPSFVEDDSQITRASDDDKIDEELLVLEDCSDESSNFSSQSPLYLVPPNNYINQK